jgi:ABC-type hemin transport system substrate-binding protein
VAASLEAVGAACGVAERGAALRSAFETRLDAVRAAAAAVAPPMPPGLLLLEWLDPPVRRRQLIPDMFRLAGAVPALNAVSCAKSVERTHLG